MNNRDEKIIPFMVSNIKIKDFSSDNAIVIPSLLIKQDIKGKYIYIIKSEGEKLVKIIANINKNHIHFVFSF